MKNEAIANKQVDKIEHHSIGKSLILHLLPGLSGGILYYATAQPIRNFGYPTIGALILAGILVLIPFEFGFLLYQAKKNNGKISLDEIVLYRQRIQIRQYFIWVPVIFVLSGLIMTFMKPVSDYLATLFTWIPEGMYLDMGLNGGYSKEVLIITYLFTFIFVVFIGPIVEELYFRGYLLPRMPPALKGWAPILHSGLFALYHTWTPWMFIARTVGVLPLIYVVQRKRNIYLGVIAHCLLNIIDVGAGVIFILSL